MGLEMAFGMSTKLGNLYRQAVGPLITTAKISNSSFNPITIFGTSVRGFQTTSVTSAWEKPRGPQSWLKNNDTVFTPQISGEEPRPANVCHQKTDIKYSPDKMWYVACLIRGMKIDDAINQLKFVHKKGAVAVLEALQEAQEMAVKEHNVEFRSNLWVAESHCGRGPVIKGYRRHARRRFGNVRYKYCHYFVRLEEGEPPADYYDTPYCVNTPQKLFEKYLSDLRSRTIQKTF